MSRAAKRAAKDGSAEKAAKEATITIPATLKEPGIAIASKAATIIVTAASSNQAAAIITLPRGDPHQSTLEYSIVASLQSSSELAGISFAV